MRIIRPLLLTAFLAGGLGYWYSLPAPLAPDAMQPYAGDAIKGQQVFTAAGCASCHSPAGADQADELILSGGQSFASPFGTFIAPNISQDPEQGIGQWTAQDLANALKRGVSPDGQHYYPAFPYASYAKMTLQDIADLHAYMKTLPADTRPSHEHQIGFPFNIRAAVGGWKMLFLSEEWDLPDDLPAEAERGRYLAEALAHCSECHTPRNIFGGLDKGQLFAGAPNPSGQGKIPAITSEKLGWSADEITSYLTTGFTPDYDSVGGHMAHVVENLSRLPKNEAAAIAAYMLLIP